MLIGAHWYNHNSPCAQSEGAVVNYQKMCVLSATWLAGKLTGDREKVGLFNAMCGQYEFMRVAEVSSG